jgi:hypothetical protein
MIAVMSGEIRGMARPPAKGGNVLVWLLSDRKVDLSSSGKEKN